MVVEVTLIIYFYFKEGSQPVRRTNIPRKGESRSLYFNQNGEDWTEVLNASYNYLESEVRRLRYSAVTRSNCNPHIKYLVNSRELFSTFEDDRKWHFMGVGYLFWETLKTI